MRTAIRRWLSRHGVRMHAQNLMLESYRNEHGGESERECGPLWRHGRCWLSWYWRGDPSDPRSRGDNHRPICLGLSWQVPSASVGISVELEDPNSDHDLSAFLGCGLFALWVHLEDVLPKRLRWRQTGTFRMPNGETIPTYDDGRVIGVRWHNGGFWWDVWHSGDQWSSTTPRWRSGSWHPLDTLLGERVYARREVERATEFIPLPEGPTRAEIVLTEDTWTRPRWPFPLRVRRALVTPHSAIPVPGKGENSWDCDDDAISALTLRAATVPEAIGRVVTSILERRQRHGGSVDWQPSAAQKA